MDEEPDAITAESSKYGGRDSGYSLEPHSDNPVMNNFSSCVREFHSRHAAMFEGMSERRTRHTCLGDDQSKHIIYNLSLCAREKLFVRYGKDHFYCCVL